MLLYIYLYLNANLLGIHSFSSRHSGNAIVNWQLWSQQVFILGPKQMGLRASLSLQSSEWLFILH